MANFRIVVLNGGSSSGKSTIARCLRSLLPEPWLTFGADTPMDAMPPRLWGSRSGIEVASDGQITVGPAIRVLRSAWLQGDTPSLTLALASFWTRCFWRVPRRGSDGVSHWMGSLCSGLVCDATRASPRREKSRVATVTWAWPPHRRAWFIAAWFTTWKWIPRKPRQWTAHGLSRSGC